MKERTATAKKIKRLHGQLLLTLESWNRDTWKNRRK